MIASRLPSFIAPHLARLAQPFDSDDWLFEPKRDGTRVLAFIDQGSVRLVNRNRVDVTERYPETVEALAKLKPGCIMDGELVVFRNGKPDFERLMARNRTTNPAKAKRAAVATPATLVAFDLLYEHFDAVMGLDLQTRRQKLQKLITRLPENRVAFSDGIIGSGFALFQAACEQEYRPHARQESRLRVAPCCGRARWRVTGLRLRRVRLQSRGASLLERSAAAEEAGGATLRGIVPGVD